MRLNPSSSGQEGKGSSCPSSRSTCHVLTKATMSHLLGGGAVFLHLKPCHAHINDINRPLMHTYKVIKEQSSDILALLSEMDYKLRREGETHYSITASAMPITNVWQKDAMMLSFPLPSFSSTSMVSMDSSVSIGMVSSTCRITRACARLTRGRIWSDSPHSCNSSTLR